MNKKALSEQDICTQFITKAVEDAGWDFARQVREHVSFTAGRVIVRGKLATRGKRKEADYILYHTPNLPIAVIEAKNNNYSVGAGMDQALGYAETLDIPFVFSSNGDGFIFHDRTGLSTPMERPLTLQEFPSPEELWERYRAWKGLTPESERIVTAPYHDDGKGKEPRYYQRIAVNRVVEAIANGKRRVLLTMATGTGKTYTAFQIIWRLRQVGLAKRTLFLADRNILVDQTRTQDFKPFGAMMTKVHDRKIDKSYEVYLSLYQAVTGNEEASNIYREFSPDFFDLVVIDECHRGSAREESAWREILDYFSGAVHVGMTATPKETKDVSNFDYFGEPVYTYSLKQGIADGFLAPYKVVRIDIDKDILGWRPPAGKRDDHGTLIEDRIYNQRDMDKTLVLNQRTELVAAKIMDYLLANNPYDKTIVFCEGVPHAERMRSALVNAVAERFPAEKDNRKYVMRITGDNPEGKAELDNFIAIEERYPVIATTSKLLSTGVDAKTCRMIVLDQRIESMIEFKQIIGRGTRIVEDAGKMWFTIMDFKKATELFADRDFDGDPVQTYQPGNGEPITPPDPPEPMDGQGDDRPVIDTGTTPNAPYTVSDVSAMILSERVQYYDKDGKLVTESLHDYTRDTVREQFSSVDAWLRRWTDADKKAAVVEELKEQGVFWEALREHVGRDYDPFDLVCHVVFDRPPLTRRERADAVRKRDVFAKYGEKARVVLNALSEKYTDQGIGAVEEMDVLRIAPLSYLGTPVELVKRFGGREKYQAAVREMERELYRPAAG